MEWLVSRSEIFHLTHAIGKAKIVYTQFKYVPDVRVVYAN